MNTPEGCLSLKREQSPADIQGAAFEKAAKRRAVDVDKYRQCAAEGLSQATTATVMGVSRERVRQIANKHDIAFESGAIDYDLECDVLNLHAEGLYDAEIARRLDRHPSTIAWVLKRNGLRGNKKPRTSKHEAAIRDLAAKGFTVKQVAAALEIHPSHVSKLKKRLNITFIADGRSTR